MPLRRLVMLAMIPTMIPRGPRLLAQRDSAPNGDTLVLGCSMRCREPASVDRRACCAPPPRAVDARRRGAQTGYLSSTTSLRPVPASPRAGYTRGGFEHQHARQDRSTALALAADRARARRHDCCSETRRSAAKTTTTIPVVMAFISIDPVHSGFVESLARPGRNITGVAMIADELSGKRLALLK